MDYLSITPDNSTLTISNGLLEVAPNGIHGSNLNSNVADGVTIQYSSNVLSTLSPNITYNPVTGSLSSVSAASIGTGTINLVANRPLRIWFEPVNSNSNPSVSYFAGAALSGGNCAVVVYVYLYDVSNGNPYCIRNCTFQAQAVSGAGGFEFTIPMDLTFTFPAIDIGAGSFTLGAGIQIQSQSGFSTVNAFVEAYNMVMQQL